MTDITVVVDDVEYVDPEIPFKMFNKPGWYNIVGASDGQQRVPRAILSGTDSIYQGDYDNGYYAGLYQSTYLDLTQPWM